jgi:hypothetical protein
MMGMPKFTAEMSLYNIAAAYCESRISSLPEPRLSQTVSPQMSPYDFSDFGSISVPYCPEGRVCYRGHCWCI